MIETFIDVETTGLPKNINGKLPSFKDLQHYESARLLEICIIQYENDKIIEKYHNIIKYDKPILNSNIHKITDEISLEKGVPIEDIIDKVIELFMNSDYIVAHNIVFDMSIIFSEVFRYNPEKLENIKYILQNKKLICTMYTYYKFKNLKKYPKLDVLYHDIFKNNRINTHTAEQDTIDMAKCYYELKKLTNEFFTLNINIIS